MGADLKETMRVQLIEARSVSGVQHAPGDRVDLPWTKALSAIEHRSAVPVIDIDFADFEAVFAEMPLPTAWRRLVLEHSAYAAAGVESPSMMKAGFNIRLFVADGVWTYPMPNAAPRILSGWIPPTDGWMGHSRRRSPHKPFDVLLKDSIANFIFARLAHRFRRALSEGQFEALGYETRNAAANQPVSIPSWHWRELRLIDVVNGKLYGPGADGNWEANPLFVGIIVRLRSISGQANASGRRRRGPASRRDDIDMTFEKLLASGKLKPAKTLKAATYLVREAVLEVTPSGSEDGLSYSAISKRIAERWKAERKKRPKK